MSENTTNKTVQKDTQELNKELHRISITTIIYKKEAAGTGDKTPIRYLVTKRSPFKKAHPNKWTVPGGGLTTDDYTSRPQTHGNAGWYGAVEQALFREIKEEVTISIGEPKYLLDLTFIRPDGVPVLVLSYYAPYLSGEVKLDEDSVDFKWVTLTEAKELDLISGIYEEIEMVEKILKN